MTDPKKQAYEALPKAVTIDPASPAHGLLQLANAMLKWEQYWNVHCNSPSDLPLTAAKIKQLVNWISNRT